MPESGKIYSFNEGNYGMWAPPPEGLHGLAQGWLQVGRQALLCQVPSSFCSLIMATVGCACIDVKPLSHSATRVS